MPRTPLPTYIFDFETIVNPVETAVWLWGSVNVDNEYFEYGTTIDSFINRYSKINCNGYFHNLKFDIQFIFYWLFHNGYRHTTERFPPKGYFSTLISDMGIFYSAKIHFFDGGTMNLFDSLRLITMSVSEMPKAFGLDIEKLNIDYEAVKTEKHEPTKTEIDYVRNDCLVVARSLRALKSQGLTKLTAASNALANFKSRFDKKEWERLFPQIDISVDKDCRKAYKGGWTYLNPEYQDKLLGNGQVYDVNSMYPWAMSYCALPWGLPCYYDGKYEYDEQFPLYIQCFEATFKLRKGAVPSVQVKGSMRFIDTEYIKESGDTPVLLYMTNVDLKLFLDTYDVDYISYKCGYKFRSLTGIFKEYIDFWYEQKAIHKKEKNWALYYLAKLMLNSLYGKFGSNPEKRSKYPYLDEENDVVKYEFGIPEIGKTAYVPIAAFITSYCRDKIIRTAIACGERFVYADTDSVHIVGTEIPNIDIDEYRLGAFKCESVFDVAKFHRAKCYIESINGELDKKCAGLPKEARELFNFDTMEAGNSFDGKLTPKNIKGGVYLKDTKFTIK